MIPGGLHLTKPEVFQALVREQILIPIFDGLDELLLDHRASSSIESLLSELLELVRDTEARVLITVREAFWKKHEARVPPSSTELIRCLNLEGFSNDQRQKFFRKRLKLPQEWDIANRLSSVIGKTLYAGAVARPEKEADRASGIPHMLELIALYVDGNPDAHFAPQSQDPLGPLLELICERENVRQKLGIDSKKQMSIFENVFRDYADEIPREEISLYVDELVPGVSNDVVERFESHAFLATSSTDVVVPRFETLRVYFIARWLSNELEMAVTKGISSDVTKVLSSQYSGSSDVLDYLVDRFTVDDQSRVLAYVSHACKMAASRSNWEGSSSALFHLCQRLSHKYQKGKRERTAMVFDLMAGARANVNKLESVIVHGQISSLDLSGRQFDHCEFRDSEFFNCTFDANTVFSNCKFLGDLAFINCSKVGLAKLNECQFSKTAESQWSELQGGDSKSMINEDTAKQAFRDILSKFYDTLGFRTIKYIDRDTGLISQNPCKDKAWRALSRAGIIQKHNISGVEGGGLNIVDDDEVKHEVRNFLDNAVMGKRLKPALKKVI